MNEIKEAIFWGKYLIDNNLVGKAYIEPIQTLISLATKVLAVGEIEGKDLILSANITDLERNFWVGSNAMLKQVKEMLGVDSK